MWALLGLLPFLLIAAGAHQLTRNNYQKRLQRDLPRWTEQGLVPAASHGGILADVAEQAKRGWLNVPTVLAGLGALLVFVGIVSMVAANWAELGRLFKVALLLAVMAAAFVAAHVARSKTYHGVGEGLLLLGTLLFGANIMLIAQIYHIAADPPAGFMLWAIGAAVVAVLWQSQLVAGAAFAIMMPWTVFAADFNYGTPLFHPQFLLLWVPLMAYALARGWQQSRLLWGAALSLLVWYGLSVVSVFNDYLSIGYSGLLVVLPLVVLGQLERRLPVLAPLADVLGRMLWGLFFLWFIIISIDEVFRSGSGYYLRRTDPDLLVLNASVFALVLAAALWAGLKQHSQRLLAGAVAYAALIGLCGWLPLLMTGQTSGVAVEAVLQGTSIILSIITVAAFIGVILWGYREGSRAAVNAGFLGFAIKVAMLYFDTFWTLAGRAPFFIVGGVLLIILALTIEKKRRALLAKMPVQ